MSKKELVVLWIIGIYTAVFTFLLGDELQDFGRDALLIGQKLYLNITKPVLMYLLPVWIVAGLFFITFRNTRKKQEREKRDNP